MNTGKHSRTCEAPIVVTACTRLVHLQARPNPSMDVESGLELPPFAEVLATGSYYREREWIFFKNVTISRSTVLQWKSHIHECRSITNWIR